MLENVKVLFSLEGEGSGKSNSMGFVSNNGVPGSNAPLRREDCEFVKHDKLFSKWKILVGPQDGREGRKRQGGAGRNVISRYLVQNVPVMEFGPGVFELGVTAPSWSPAPHDRNQRALPLKREDVIPVYVGQAASIRQRLQRFGQTGAHLEPSLRSVKLYRGDEDLENYCGSSISTSLRELYVGGVDVKHLDGNGPRLFSEVFALGSSIVFRWAHTDSKVVAEKVQAELSVAFDYAWNKGINGTRRPRDILAKLSIARPVKESTNSSNTSWNPISSSTRSHLRSRNNAVGIKVALRKPQGSSSPSNSPNRPKSPKSPRTKLGLKLCSLVTVQPQIPIEGGGGGAKSPRSHSPMQSRQKYLHPERVIESPGREFTKNAISSAATRFDHFSLTSCAEHSGWRLGFQSCFPTRTRRLHCKEAENNNNGGVKQERPSSIVERRRPGSLSFNTWVNVTDDRHKIRSNHGGGGGGVKAGFPALQQQQHLNQPESSKVPPMYSGIDPQRNRKMSFMYAPMPVEESRRG